VFDTQKRVSARAIALHYGLPQNVVYRAISSGELPAASIKTKNKTRAYILPQDAEVWFNSLLENKNFKSLMETK
jgi:hypothetical protein